MTLEDLRTFVAVCDAGSLSAAAEALHKSQPGVSQHIARLEQELGVALLERRARGVVPTAAGAALHESASRSLAELSRMRERIDALRSGHAGSLAVVTGGTTLKHFMQGAIVRFRRDHPNVPLRFHQGYSTAHCIELLRKEPIDLGFVRMRAEQPGVEQRPVLMMEHALLLCEGHPLAQRARLVPQDLHGLALIGLAPRNAALSKLAERLASRGIALQTSTSVEDWDLAYVLVKLGLGSAIVPAFHAYEFVRQGAVVARPIDDLPALRFGWVARRFASLAPPALSFMQLMDAELRADERPGVRVLGDESLRARGRRVARLEAVTAPRAPGVETPVRQQPKPADPRPRKPIAIKRRAKHD